VTPLQQIIVFAVFVLSLAAVITSAELTNRKRGR